MRCFIKEGHSTNAFLWYFMALSPRTALLSLSLILHVFPFCPALAHRIVCKDAGEQGLWNVRCLLQPLGPCSLTLEQRFACISHWSLWRRSVLWGRKEKRGMQEDFKTTEGPGHPKHHKKNLQWGKKMACNWGSASSHPCLYLCLATFFHLF